MPERISAERAAERFYQIHALQEDIDAVDVSLAGLKAEAADVAERMSALKATKRDLQEAIRQAAKDRGELPLIHLMDYDPVAASR